MSLPSVEPASDIPLTAFVASRRTRPRARAEKSYPSLPTRARVVNYILGIDAFAVSNDAVSYLRQLRAATSCT